MAFHLSTLSKALQTLCPILHTSRLSSRKTLNICAKFHHGRQLRTIHVCHNNVLKYQPLLACRKMMLNRVPVPGICEQRAGVYLCANVHSPTTLSGSTGEKKGDNPSTALDPGKQTGWVIRLANENGYLSWCRNTYLATVVGVGMWAEGPSSIAFHATEGALFLGGLNLVLGTISYLHTIFRVRRTIHMSLVGAGLHTLAALTHLGIWLTVVITYLGYVESEEEARHPGITELENIDSHIFHRKEE